MCRKLPAARAISPFSAAWVAEQSQPGRPLVFAGLTVAPDPATPSAGGLPLYRDPGAAGIAHRVHCSGVPYSTSVCARFHMEGESVRVPPDAAPDATTDRHLSIEDDAKRRELDFWGVTAPSGRPGSPLDVLTAGQCPYDGDGTDCSGATATNIATSLGTIDPGLVREAERDPHGTLPYAIATTLLCASPTWVFPATFSDGFNTDRTPACRDHLGPNGRPPEGVRWFLDVSDATIDATPNPPYDKVILRTLDREHFGGTVTDSNWSGAPGPSLQSMRDGWAPIFTEPGITPGGRGLTIATAGIDLAKVFTFCSNGTCAEP